LISALETNTFIEFSIEDTGIGIPNKEINFIFEKFYRTDKSRHSKTGGTGLGLNIVKSLVELHGGSIHAESELNKGTKVTVKLPK
jgi:signal transduction histidine kinase